LLSLLENLDKKAETTTLSEQEIHLKHFLKESLVLLLREEELKWYERAKVKTLLEGDDNTRFFHLVANGKHRKQHIYKLENDQGVVIGDCRMDLPGPTTSVGTRTDYSVGPWDYSACATRHPKAWSTRTTQE
jgi:hypothetical protein